MLKKYQENFGRILTVMVAIVAIVLGVLSLVAGRLGYPNYWGGFVFAPFGIVIGLLAILAAFKHRTIREKLRGRKKRLARQAENTKFPIETFTKW